MIERMKKTKGNTHQSSGLIVESYIHILLGISLNGTFAIISPASVTLHLQHTESNDPSTPPT
jgi:hypothetical protein